MKNTDKLKILRSKITIKIILFMLVICIGILVMHDDALQNEFPDKVIQVKEDKNIVYFTMCFEGTINIPDNNSKKDLITEYSMATGFHGSKSGHIFIPVHCIEYSDDEVKELLLMEYIMSSKWFDEKLFEDETYLSYYHSDGAKQHFNELKEKLDDKTLEIVDIRPTYRVYCPREEGSLPLKKQDIVFDGSTKDKDIAIFETEVTDTSVIFNKDFKYEEGTKLYIIHYAEHTIYDHVDDIVKDRETCPSEYKDVLTNAKEEMFEKIRDRGADIESGYLGSTTRPWRASTAYRFTGCTPAGSSGAPVLDGQGRCVGMITCGPELIKGVVDPTNAYFIPYRDLEAASNEAGFEPPIDIPPLDKVTGSKLYNRYGLVMTIIGIIGMIVGIIDMLRRRSKKMKP